MKMWLIVVGVVAVDVASLVPSVEKKTIIKRTWTVRKRKQHSKIHTPAPK